MNKRIEKMIKEYGDERDFFGAASDEAISKAEIALDVKFPAQYLEYVKKYGGGGIGGNEITGVKDEGYASVLEATESWRKLGLPDKLFVVWGVDEYAYCMFSADANDEKVYTWSPDGDGLIFKSETFDAFIIDSFENTIANWV